jgi:hypothetical protein
VHADGRGERPDSCIASRPSRTIDRWWTLLAEPRGPLPRGGATLVKAVVTVVVIALGTLAAVGCLLAALFEQDGFGSPRDQGPRTGYLVELGAGFVASVVIPAVVCRRLFPGSGPVWLLAGAIASAGVIVIAGVGLVW